ncbi:hypothetical protein [Siphonobacter curvatus]|uniref:Uncharacterized protein n=1 Tax=Siphonobacter curvatus TaxID=2094562 RepID=A0A2S7IN79_9BACT|nr:hypothetical protein [Siphonobacter curvatus]PQA59177.1 hypothetical protein C5O19_05840 [Siphonobacter curvatus]
MRSNNKYLQKVQDELDLYRRHLLLGEELSFAQKQVFEKVNVARGWLKSGYSDTQVITLLKNDQVTDLQERRAREILSIAYDLYADIRLSRNHDGVKFLYAEMFREAGWMVYEQAKNAFDLKERKEGAELMKTFRALMAEAAQFDGAYDAKAKDMEGKKKPTKVVLKQVSKNVNGQIQNDFTKEEHYEIGE